MNRQSIIKRLEAIVVRYSPQPVAVRFGPSDFQLGCAWIDEHTNLAQIFLNELLLGDSHCQDLLPHVFMHELAHIVLGHSKKLAALKRNTPHVGAGYWQHVLELDPIQRKLRAGEECEADVWAAGELVAFQERFGRSFNDYIAVDQSSYRELAGGPR